MEKKTKNTQRGGYVYNEDRDESKAGNNKKGEKEREREKGEQEVRRMKESVLGYSKVFRTA